MVDIKEVPWYMRIAGIVAIVLGFVPTNFYLLAQGGNNVTYSLSIVGDVIVACLILLPMVVTSLTAYKSIADFIAIVLIMGFMFYSMYDIGRSTCGGSSIGAQGQAVISLSTIGWTFIVTSILVDMAVGCKK